MTRQLTSFTATGLDLAPLDEPETREALLKLCGRRDWWRFEGWSVGWRCNSAFSATRSAFKYAPPNSKDQYSPRYDADAGLSERLNRQWLSRQFSSVQL